MSEVAFYQVDAFAESALAGNPAAVMPLNAFLPDALMQAIAAENNLAETAFVVAKGDGVWDLRWFTPAIEVPLCGHATLASAHVIFSCLGHAGDAIGFDTKSGRLTVRQLDDGRLEMDFPAIPVHRIEPPSGLSQALGAEPREVYEGSFVMAVFDSADDVRALRPDIRALKNIGGLGPDTRGNFICTAPGDNGFDVVSRFFAPGSGIDEDPATGSAHCNLAPYWSERLGKAELSCFQAYPGRGGVIATRVAGERVALIGRARTVIEGVFHLSE